MKLYRTVLGAALALGFVTHAYAATSPLKHGAPVRSMPSKASDADGNFLCDAGWYEPDGTTPHDMYDFRIVGYDLGERIVVKAKAWDPNLDPRVGEVYFISNADLLVPGSRAEAIADLQLAKLNGYKVRFSGHVGGLGGGKCAYRAADYDGKNTSRGAMLFDAVVVEPELGS